jgi:hypothetical protein
MTKTIEAEESINPQWAVVDVHQRSLDALDRYPSFFDDPAHTSRVDAVEQIVKKFFTVRNGMYRNYRVGRGKPFTVIKVDKPNFPNHLSRAERDRLYHTPLAQLGVEPIFSKKTNSYLFRVY